VPTQATVKEHSQSQNMPVNPTSSVSSIFDRLPPKVILSLAAPYLAGKNASQAIKTAQKIFAQDRFCGTLDILGENATSEEECQGFTKMFLQLIDTVSVNKLPTSVSRGQLSVSMKPSMFSVSPSAQDSKAQTHLKEAFDRIATVVAYAKKNNVQITLEAEDRHWTDFHLRTYFTLIEEGYDNIGTVLQTRLYRTSQDVEHFDERMRVRLVIGIYNEPASVAYRDKARMKELLVRYAGQLLARGVYVELATHDSECIERFFLEEAIPKKFDASRFETQFLLGVPRAKLQRALVSGAFFNSFPGVFDRATEIYLNALRESGVLVRMYLPFGEESIAAPYCARRLKNNSNLIGYGIKNLLRLE